MTVGAAGCRRRIITESFKDEHDPDRPRRALRHLVSATRSGFAVATRAWIHIGARIAVGMVAAHAARHACLAGFLWAAGVAGQRLAADLPTALEGQDLQVRGAIVSLPEVAGRSTRFLFALQATPTATDWQAASRTVRLSWYDAPPLQAGQGWQLNLRLKRRHGFHNPGGFDYAGWLLQNGITATGYVRTNNSNQPWPSADAADPLLSLRHAVDQRLQKSLAAVSHRACCAR